MPAPQHVVKVMEVESATYTAATNITLTRPVVSTNPNDGSHTGWLRHALIIAHQTAGAGLSGANYFSLHLQGSENNTDWVQLPHAADIEFKSSTSNQAVRVDGPLPPFIRLRVSVTGSPTSATFSAAVVIGG